MSIAVSRGQALQINARVGTQVDWDKLNGDELQSEVIDLPPKEFGRRFTNFLKNGANYPSAKRSDLFILTSDGVSTHDLPKYLKNKGFRISSRACDMMANDSSFVTTSGMTYALGVIFGDDFFGEQTIENIRKEALCRGWLPAPAEVAYLAYEKFSKEELRNLGIRNLLIMHKPVYLQNGANLFCISEIGEMRYLDAQCLNGISRAKEDHYGYCFLVPQMGE